MVQLERLAKVEGLVHGFSTRWEEGNQGFGYGPKAGVIQNRGQFLRKASSLFHIGSGMGMVPFQKGKEEVIALVGPDQGGRGIKGPNAGPECEALITTYRAYERFMESDEHPLPAAFYLYVPLGDCIPIIVYHPSRDPRRRVLALIHGSRVSTVREIAQKTVHNMKENLELRPSQMIAGLGPGIKAISYRIDGKPFDLFGENVEQLKAAGIPAAQIEVSPINTFTDRRFASHRRSKATGKPEWRHACVVGMLPIE